MPVETEAPKPLPAAKGAGPLLQRDYVGVVEGAGCSPEEVMNMVRQRFTDLAPSETADFECAESKGRPLNVGDDLKIRIGGFFPCQVRVVQTNAHCLTLRTLAGHPEAGRISFQAARDDRGRLTFQIRSRARASGPIHLLGFLLLGRTMQARCWIRFIGSVVDACGGRLDGPVEVRTARVVEDAADRGECDRSTFDRDAGG